MTWGGESHSILNLWGFSPRINCLGQLLQKSFPLTPCRRQLSVCCSTLYGQQCWVRILGDSPVLHLPLQDNFVASLQGWSALLSLGSGSLNMRERGGVWGGGLCVSPSTPTLFLKLGFRLCLKCLRRILHSGKNKQTTPPKKLKQQN